MGSNRGPVIGLGLLLGASLGVSPLLVRKVIEPDVRRSAEGWLRDAGAEHVIVEEVKGEDITLRGPANEMNLAIEAVLRSRGNRHWANIKKTNTERNDDTPTTTTTAAPRVAISGPVVSEPPPATTVAAPPSTVAVPLPAPAVSSNIVAKPNCAASLPVLTGTSFAIGATTLTADAKGTLDQVAAALKGAAGCNVSIGSHTDTRGDASYNQQLSLDRANAVRAYLISQGVAADRLTAVGYGETKPKVNPEVTADDRAANRRIEFTTTAGS
jgi:outer membrane protein OmpA-like peptidoglycan-associated protein